MRLSLDNTEIRNKETTKQGPWRQYSLPIQFLTGQGLTKVSRGLLLGNYFL